MRTALSVAVVLGLAAPAAAQPKPALTPREAADGWIMLFDGETTFGWKTEGDVKVDGGLLVVRGAGGGKITSAVQFPVPVEIVSEWKWTGTEGAVLGLGGQGSSIPAGQWTEHHLTIVPDGVGYRSSTRTRVAGGDWVAGIGAYGGLGDRTVSTDVLKGAVASFRSIKLRPLGTTSLFNGKDLTGWTVNAADPKRAASKFEVTPAGELEVKNGPGDLKTDKAFGNFLFQTECKSNGKALNSGVFFRCVPGQYQNGYEAQIQNGYLGDDRTKPADFGTGAIYRRVPARKVVSNDHEWFTLTVLADGPHIATWVNGYQTVAWTDTRKADDNPRQGLRTASGHLSLQGHDPTTDLLFRNIRIAEIADRKN
jgi:hypothetical protein